MATDIRSVSESVSRPVDIRLVQEDLHSEEKNCFLERVWISFTKAMNYLLVSIGNLLCCRFGTAKSILSEAECLTPQIASSACPERVNESDISTPTLPRVEEVITLEPTISESQSSSSSSLPLLIETSLDNENEELRKEINGISSRILLPQPVENLSVIQDISNLTDQQTVDILVNPGKASSPIHLQAIRYLNVMGQSQKTNVNKIFTSVFLGNYDALRTVDPSKGNNPNKFRRIISVTRQDPNTGNEFTRVSIPEDIERIVMKVDDEQAAWVELEMQFDKLFQFIDGARIAKKNILIHCTQGQSRSATVLLAYMVNRLHVSLQDALVFLKTKRFLVEPIPGFLRRLSEYEKRLGSQLASALL